MPTDREAGIAMAILACGKLVETCDEDGCCDLCGAFHHDEHDDDCPYVDAKKALQLLGLEK